LSCIHPPRSASFLTTVASSSLVFVFIKGLALPAWVGVRVRAVVNEIVAQLG
jgi:hypothetical protein